MERLGAGALTPRERDCLTLLAKGLRPDRIADRLGLAKVTVDMHLRGARQRMKARTLAEAVARAVVARQIDIL
jgi:DNA-binding CsgD family transcriptional regulator